MWSTWPARYLEYLEYLEWATQLFTKTLRSLSRAWLEARAELYPPYPQSGWMFRHQPWPGSGGTPSSRLTGEISYYGSNYGLVSPSHSFIQNSTLLKVKMLSSYCFLVSRTSASYWGKQRRDCREYKPTTYRLKRERERQLPGIISGYNRAVVDQSVMKQK